MTEKEMFLKNLILGTEFDRYVMEHPEFVAQIPDGAQIGLLPEYDPELSEINLQLAKKQRTEGQPLVIVKIPRLAPESKSRLLSPSLQLMAAA
ncbi:MAG: hypothetical protein QME81_11530 [bacterium]|nr:hypothetical protein [bacterium]